jgi:uncharacterized protein YecE (DUF72 family)
MPDPISHRTVSAACRLLVGTSGYSYGEWTDAGFYPSNTKPGAMLSHYARRFPITELNFTWYQMPKASALERMRRNVPDHFCFTAKLNRALTHEIDPGQWRSHVTQYRDGIAPLIQSGQLAAVLLQFPPTFRRLAENRRYLAALLDELQGLPLALEFRHASWDVDRVYAEFRQRQVTLVSVDTPELPNLFPRRALITNPAFFYIRFHGRNTKGWRSGNMQEQFNYDYRDVELIEWVEACIEPLARQAQRGLIFFNNHVRAQAPRNAERLIDHLIARGLTVARPEPPEQPGAEEARWQ